MGNFQVDQPQIIKKPAQITAVIHIVTPRENIRSVMGDGYRELMETVARQGIKTAGPWYTHHLRMDPHIFDLEIGEPVSTPVLSYGRVMASVIPAMTLIKTIYHGDYERLAEAWSEFTQWIAENGYEPAEDMFEIYLVGPETTSDPDQWQTELSRPIFQVKGTITG
jgi:effector-binding domain-containing protein